MKKSFVRGVLWVVAVGAVLAWPGVAWANDDGNALKQADDLVKQAWNPGGDPVTNDQRVQWLTKALELAKSEPDRRLRGNNVVAMRLMKSALEELKRGDPNGKVADLLQEADRDLRVAMEDAEAH